MIDIYDYGDKANNITYIFQGFYMKIIAALTFLMVSFLNLSAMADSLSSMNRIQVKKAFVNKTAVSIATDNLDGHTIDNTFSMFLNERGNIFGKMSHKPVGEPQTDKGVYQIAANGTFYITWQHWDGGKKLCGRLFKTKNAYISVDCDNVFHTVFMMEMIKEGNGL